MSEELKNITCLEFINQLSSKMPYPSGGSSAALVGALGAALLSMAGKLTADNKKYFDKKEEINEILIKNQAIQDRLIELIDEDVKGFEPLSKAYRIKKDNPNRIKIMQEALFMAIVAPINIMKECTKVIELLDRLKDICSKLLLSDVACAAILAVASLKCASFNVFINSKMIIDDNKRAKIEKDANSILDEYIEKAEKIIENVRYIM